MKWKSLYKGGVQTAKKSPHRFWGAFKQVKGSAKISKKKWDSMCMFFYGNKCRLIPAQISSDLREVTPKGFEISVENKNSYLLEPENLELFIIDLENVSTVSIGDKVEVKTIQKIIENLEKNPDEKVGGLVKTYDLKEVRYKGAEELNRRAYQIFQTALLKFMDEPQRKETMLIILVSMFFGSVVTFIASIILFS